MSEQRTVYVVARLSDCDEPSDPEDTGVEGVYEIGIDADLPEQDVASAALDAFHCSWPVTILDDFNFEVRDEAWNEIFEPDDVQTYSLDDRAAFRGQLAQDPDFRPDTAQPRPHRRPTL